METTSIKGDAVVADTRSNSGSLSLKGKVMNMATENYFAVISMTISIGSILGGIAAMYIFENGAPLWQLIICMMGAMANNVCAIGQAPVKWMVNIFLTSTILNIGLILINVIS